MSKAADDYDNIARRLKEIEAEKLARVGAPVHIQHDAATGETLVYKVGDYAVGWPMHSIEDVYG